MALPGTTEARALTTVKNNEGGYTGTDGSNTQEGATHLAPTSTSLRSKALIEVELEQILWISPMT